MPSQLVIKNLSQVNTIKVSPQDAERDPKTSKILRGKWKPSGADLFVPKGQSTDVWVGDGRRIIVEEIPS